MPACNCHTACTSRFRSRPATARPYGRHWQQSLTLVKRIVSTFKRAEPGWRAMIAIPASDTAHYRQDPIGSAQRH